MTKPFYIKCILLIPLLLLLSLISNVAIGQSLTGSVSGKVVNEKGEALDYASVQVLQNGIIRGATYTDEDGSFNIKRLATGSYVLKFSYLGYPNFSVQNIEVAGNQTTIENIVLKKDSCIGEGVMISTPNYIDPVVPGQDIYNQDQIRTILGGHE